MAIPVNKSRITVTLKDFTKSSIEYLSEVDKRTPSRQIEYIIEDYVNKLCATDEDLSDELDEYYTETYKPKEVASNIFNYYKQIFKATNNRYKDLPLEERFNMFEASLLKDAVLKRDFDTFNGDNNKVLFYIDSLLIESNVEKDILAKIENIIIDILVV